MTLNQRLFLFNDRRDWRIVCKLQIMFEQTAKMEMFFYAVFLSGFCRIFLRFHGTVEKKSDQCFCADKVSLSSSHIVSVLKTTRKCAG